MARYKHCDYDQMMLVPVLLEDQLMPGTLEYAIHHVVEERLDLSFFEERYCNDETGRKAIDPKVLIKIVLFWYSRGLISSRTLERACKENITFMALSCGQQPDHSTLAAFVSSVDEKHQVVVHAEAYGKGEDASNMEPMLSGAKNKLQVIGKKEPLKDKQVSADTGYM